MIRRLVPTALVLLSVVACTDPTGEAAPPAPTTTKPATVQTGLDGCMSLSLTAEMVEKVKGTANVTAASVVGQCTRLVVTTDLVLTGGQDAVKTLCDEVSTLAYATDVESVSLESADKSELAIGVKGAPCLVHP